MILAKVVFILTVWLIHASSFSIVPPGPQRTKPCCIRELRLCSQTDDTDASKATYDNHPFVGKIGFIPYHRLDVKSDGMPNDESTAEKLTEWVLGNDLKNVWVVSHGWNTPPEYTWQNFKGLFQQVERHLQQNNHGSMLKQFGVIGITWNSVTKDDPLVQLEEYRKEFPEDDKEVEEIKKKIEDLLDLGQDYDGILDYDNNNLAWDSVENLDKIDKVREELDKAISNLYLKDEVCGLAFDTDDDYDIDDDKEYGLDIFEFGEEDEDLIEIHESYRGRIDFPSFPFNFHLMMKRAVKLGRGPISFTLKSLVGANVRLHLVGHSFGALLVSTAVHENGKQGDVASMCLLQGSFSHNAFAKEVVTKWPSQTLKRGMFRDTIEKNVVSGPIVVTHTKRDRALSIAYPIAARFLREKGTELLGVQPFRGRFGAIGSSGALGPTNEVVFGDMTEYELIPGKLNNLKSDDEITGHNDVWNDHVACLVVDVATSV